MAANDTNDAVHERAIATEGSSSFAAAAPGAQSIHGVLHFVPPNLSAFEPTKPQVDSKGTNTLIWIGGLMDTYMSVSYPLVMSKAMPSNWSVVVACLASSGTQFGIRSLTEDVNDISKIVSYIKSRRPHGKIVLMGHSTGCQDCVEYLRTKAAEEPVHGIILQAPVSDRQAIPLFLSETQLHEINQKATEWCRSGHAKDVLPSHLTSPMFMNAPITAQRWLDLASPGPNHEGADDLFSSDLSVDRLGKVFKGSAQVSHVLILQSGDDEFVPKSIDKGALIDKWSIIIEQKGGHVDKNHSGVIHGATHNLNASEPAVVQDLTERVLGFLSHIAAWSERLL